MSIQSTLRRDVGLFGANPTDIFLPVVVYGVIEVRVAVLEKAYKNLARPNVNDRVLRTIQSIISFEHLATFEGNASRHNALDDEVRLAIKNRSIELGRALIAERSGLDLTDLTPVEEKIVHAVSEYVGVMKREGKDATRTFIQLRNRGLLEAAEAAVTKATPTQGYRTLADAHLSDLSYEQIIVDHPEEFSARALWHARRTLGIENESARAPAQAITPVQRRTEHFIAWLQERAEMNDGLLPPHTNSEAAATLGLGDMHRFGRVFGNIQSRIDFACYLAGLPPLGLTAAEPFTLAWNQAARSWSFPVAEMQTAARTRLWTEKDFDAVRGYIEGQPGQAHFSWQPEMSERELKVQAWAFGLSGRGSAAPPTDVSSATHVRNPNWAREELILALDLYLRFRQSPPGKTSPEVRELSELLRQIAINAMQVSSTYRNANGVYMKMMNFRSIDPEYTANGRVGLSSINELERSVWDEFADNAAELEVAARAIRASVSRNDSEISDGEGLYWVFVCNPKKWAIDRFLDRGIERDSWGIRPSDRERFAPGQLGIIRVGLDQRSAEERGGKPPLESGIYALCEVESAAFEGKGASDEFWADGKNREPGWPTVQIRYLRTYASKPLAIDRLRRERPALSKLLLRGFQGASFPISAADFHAVMELLGEDLEALPAGESEKSGAADDLAELERKYINASPEVKTRVSRYIERGPVGAAVKRSNGFKCQICDELGLDPIGFYKVNGEPYVEAHHVMPVFRKEVGSLSVSNVMTVCPNHHRQLHYGGLTITIAASVFEVTISGVPLRIPRAIASALNL